MKKFSEILLGLSAITCLFASCTKEDGVFKEGGSNGIIQLNLPSNESAQRAYPLQTVSFDAAASVDFPITIEYLGTESAPTDITVTMGIVDAAVTAYNTSASTSYVVLDPLLYTIPSNTVVIPAGKKSATFLIKLKTANFDFSKAYAIGVGIRSVTTGTVSGNYGTGVYRVVAKNAFEGSYTATGYLFHPSAGRAINATYSITTVGATTSQAPVGDLGGSNYYFNFNVNGSTVNSFVPVGATPTGSQSGFFTADQPAASGTWAPAGTTPGSGAYVHSTYNNTYNASTKTFFLHYGYGVGAAGETGWTRQVYEKLVRN